MSSKKSNYCCTVGYYTTTTAQQQEVSVLSVRYTNISYATLYKKAHRPIMANQSMIRSPFSTLSEALINLDCCLPTSSAISNKICWSRAFLGWNESAFVVCIYTTTTPRQTSSVRDHFLLRTTTFLLRPVRHIGLCLSW